jgi:hypothetical protein
VNRWFTYPPYDEHDFLARVLGRDLSGPAARLEGHALATQGAYTYLLPDPEQNVDGTLITLRLGDDWLLDDEFGIALGYYRRVELAVQSGGETHLAWVMLGGPALATIQAEPVGTHIDAPPGQEEIESA